MDTSTIERQLDDFGRTWDYDVTYMKQVLEAGGTEAIAGLQALQTVAAYRRDCPPDVYYAAKLPASRRADCGPCLQLTVRMAEREGVAPEHVRAILTGDREGMTPDMRLAYDLSAAALDRDGWDIPAREAFVARFGQRALIALAYGIAIAGFYPTFKAVWGAAHACERVQVGSSEVALAAR